MILIAAPIQLFKHVLEWGLDGVVSPLESCVTLISLPPKHSGLTCFMEEKEAL